ncbi:NAD(P)-dependent oxidoreductase [Mycobacterium sp. 1245852.3]|uniref:SDR family oxidoreductase n=1 Tax=Mycobacterium sp. 1245852.3 TaxID=1856860 RepID=UPI0007FEB1B1|nr:NAD(P)-dependent oxidoreductase [Mycobacterium sp. 1245852.3]OBJ83291.1 short chain dehydrogenase [Mycobacterium sp. 1245852.3]
MPFTGRTAVISGGSRGIGLEIASALGSRGANIVLLAKTAEPTPKLPGTIHTAVAEIERRGGTAVAVCGDVRHQQDVRRAVDVAVNHFGGIDMCINNASALNLSSTTDLELSKFDLMIDVNIRGTFALTQACLPYLKTSPCAHILTLSPPINLSPKWLGAHPAYTLSKYGMSTLALGFAEELRAFDIASNCLWPETTIATAAVNNVLGGEQAMQRARQPAIMADAACLILQTPPSQLSGQCLIDADVLTNAGVSDLSRYGGQPPLQLDIFVDARSE